MFGQTNKCEQFSKSNDISTNFLVENIVKISQFNFGIQNNTQIVKKDI